MKNNTNLPTIGTYGDYSNSNYGAHCLCVSFPDNFTLYYSYETIIAFTTPGITCISENNWGPTTGKHLNCIDDDKSKRLPRDEFEKQLARVLKSHKLA